MTPPQDTEKLIRPLVRIPGSGSNKDLPIKIMDLSRASALAAIAMSRIVPPNLQPTNVRKIHPLKKSPLDKKVLNVTERPRLMYMTQEEIRQHSLPNLQPTNVHPLKKLPLDKKVLNVTGRPRLVYMTPEEICQIRQHSSQIVKIPIESEYTLFLSQPISKVQRQEKDTLKTSSSAPQSVALEIPLSIPQSTLTLFQDILKTENQVLHQVVKLIREKDILKQKNYRLRGSLFQRIREDRRLLLNFWIKKDVS